MRFAGARAADQNNVVGHVVAAVDRRVGELIKSAPDLLKNPLVAQPFHGRACDPSRVEIAAARDAAAMRTTGEAVLQLPQALPAEPWLYVGGALGFVYILLASFLVAHTGVLLLGLGSVLGQLAGSIVIDLIWPAAAGPALWQLVAMIALAAASVVVAMPRRRRA